MKTFPDLGRRILALAIPVAVASALPATSLAQANASGRLQTSTAQCPNDGFAVPSGSAGNMAAIIAFSNAQCQLFAGGFAYAGVVGASANVNSRTGGVGTVFQRADASGSWNDGLQVVWPNSVSVGSLHHLRLTFNIDAQGGVSANQIEVSPTFGTGSADIDYSFNFAGFSRSGSQRIEGGGVLSSTGVFGTIAGVVDLAPTGVAAGAYNFSDISIALSGGAHALVQSIAFSLDGPAIIADASGNANSNRILQWRGVVGVQAFDSDGAEVTLPTGFALGLIGNQTGFNYWNEAPLAPVPEPAHWALLPAGLALLTQVAIRRPRRA